MPPHVNLSVNCTREQYTNDSSNNQRVQMHAPGTTQPHTLATCVGMNPSYATNSSTHQTQSRVSDSIRSTQGSRLRFQRISNALAALSTTSRSVLHASPISNRLHYMYLSRAREESVIPEDAVFPIEIPIIPRPINASFFDSELGRQRRNVPELQRSRDADVGPAAAWTVLYDDNEIPQNDFLWLVRPHQHPWIRSGLAYLCPYNSCDTIVQERNRHVHNERVHGIHGY